jgi:macrolide transport system ATP-binding/permease protein
MQLVAAEVSFAYPARPDALVLRDVSLRIGPGVRVGLVGENGSGKSTLLAVLAGLLDPTAGEVRTQGTLALVEQEFVFAAGETIGDIVRSTLAGARRVHAALAAAATDVSNSLNAAAQRAPADRTPDNLVAATGQAMAALNTMSELIARVQHLAAWDVDRRVDEALTRLGAPRDLARPLATLSVGERYRVRLACRLAEHADLLLLDEPTNHLDDAAISYLTAQLQATRGGVVLVTHDRQLLDDVATAIFDLDPSMDGRAVLYGQPGYLAYRFAKAQALHRWRQRFAAQQTKQAELLAMRDRSYEGLSDEWRPVKGSQKHRRATRARTHVKAADRVIARLEASAVGVPTPPLELVFPDLPSLVPGADPGLPLVEVRNPAVVGRLDLPGTRIAVPPAGRLLVVGGNGTGKSTLLAVLAGRLGLDRGTRTGVPGVRMGIVGQENAAIVERATDRIENITGFDAAENEVLALLAHGRLDPDYVVPILGLGLLTESDLDRPLADLSVGQRRRFEIARALIAAPHLLIFDEPTNHLSVDLVDALTQALRHTSAAVVVATHDRRMRDDLAEWPTIVLR